MMNVIYYANIIYNRLPRGAEHQEAPPAGHGLRGVRLLISIMIVVIMMINY